MGFNAVDRMGVGGGGVRRRHILHLAVYALALKAAIVAVLLASSHGSVGFLSVLGSRWDSLNLVEIAEKGYPHSAGSQLYAFSPVYPALIRLTAYLVRSYPLAGIVVTNLIGFAASVTFLYLMGYEAAVLSTVFPTFAYYSTAAYSDVFTLVFVAAALLYVKRNSFLLAGVCYAVACLNTYSLILAGAAILVYALTRTEKPVLNATLYALPVAVAGGSILAGYYLSTGSAFTWFRLESAVWGAHLVTPIYQAEWLLNLNGSGWFTAQVWQVLGIQLTPVYWLVRNMVFEAFYFLGVYLLARGRGGVNKLWAGYCALVSIPLLFVVGTPAASIPRLLLPAFPVFYPYAQKIGLNGIRFTAYLAACVAATMVIALVQAYAFFA
ncbi:MAG: hypothetical protein M1357_03385 [Candidatus Marsarchaeota archaeon]|nr:hypothetical protein [Candidatus Marsarchaeota archaeon]